MKHFFSHLKKYMFRGLLAIIPLVLTVLVLQLLYVGIDRRFAVLIDEFFGYSIPGLGILLVIITLYVLGLIASNVVGRRFLHLIERITHRIPIIGTTYQVGSQLSKMISLPEREVFKEVVLVDFLKPGMWTVGFVTGSVMDKKNNEKLLKVYVPTPPNPTSGTLLLVREAQTRNPGWTIDEGVKAVISGGIIGPAEIN